RDWSSDVCSSDLVADRRQLRPRLEDGHRRALAAGDGEDEREYQQGEPHPGLSPLFLTGGMPAMVLVSAAAVAGSISLRIALAVRGLSLDRMAAASSGCMTEICCEAASGRICE